MAINLEDSIQASQALTIDVVGKQFALTSNRQTMIGDRKFDKSGENPRFGPQSEATFPSTRST